MTKWEHPSKKIVKSQSLKIDRKLKLKTGTTIKTISKLLMYELTLILNLSREHPPKKIVKSKPKLKIETMT